MALVILGYCLRFGGFVIVEAERELSMLMLMPMPIPILRLGSASALYGLCLVVTQVTGMVGEGSLFALEVDTEGAVKEFKEVSP